MELASWIPSLSTDDRFFADQVEELATKLQYQTAKLHFHWLLNADGVRNTCYWSFIRID